MEKGWELGAGGVNVAPGRCPAHTRKVILEMHQDGVPAKIIAKYLKTSEEQVVQIIENQNQK